MATNLSRGVCLGLLILTSALATQAAAATLIDDFAHGPSAAWRMSTGRNGPPFGCTFTDSANYVHPASPGMIIKADASRCGELFTANNYAYGTLEVRMAASNTPGSVASAFMISGGPGSQAPWEEMDIEVLPSYAPGRVHFAVIHQGDNHGKWGIEDGEKIYDTYAENPTPIGSDGLYRITWSDHSIKFFGGPRLLWTVRKGNRKPRCNVTVGATTASPACYIPASDWPVSNKSIRLNTWAGDGSAWPGHFYPSSSAHTRYDYVHYH